MFDYSSLHFNILKGKNRIENGIKQQQRRFSVSIESVEATNVNWTTTTKTETKKILFKEWKHKWHTLLAKYPRISMDDTKCPQANITFVESTSRA